MQTKIKRSELQQFYDTKSTLPRDIVVHVHSILEADAENEDFLLGFASALLMLAKTEKLPSDLQLIIAASIRECAVSIESRKKV